MQKNILGSAIKKIRKQKKLTQEKMSELTGFSQNTISQHENGKRALDENVILAYADALDISPNYFFEYFENDNSNYIDKINNIVPRLEVERQKKVYDYSQKEWNEQKSIRIYGQVVANPEVLDYVDESYEEYITDEIPPGAEGALVVTGDSMEPEYKNGSIVFYKRQPNVEEGQLAVVDIDGVGSTFKKFYRDYENEEIILRSINSEKYPDRHLTPERVRVIGIVLN